MQICRMRGDRTRLPPAAPGLNSSVSLLVAIVFFGGATLEGCTDTSGESQDIEVQAFRTADQGGTSVAPRRPEGLRRRRARRDAKKSAVPNK